MRNLLTGLVGRVRYLPYGYAAWLTVTKSEPTTEEFSLLSDESMKIACKAVVPTPSWMSDSRVFHIVERAISGKRVDVIDYLIAAYSKYKRSLNHVGVRLNLKKPAVKNANFFYRIAEFLSNVSDPHFVELMRPKYARR